MRKPNNKARILKAGVDPKVVFWLGIMVLTQIFPFQAIKNLYAYPTYLRFKLFCKFFGDFCVYLGINSFPVRINEIENFEDMVLL